MKKITLICKIMKAILKDKNHSHFWIQDGQLFESYNTIRGLRYRFIKNVDGFADTNKCTPYIINKIEKESR